MGGLEAMRPLKLEPLFVKARPFRVIFIKQRLDQISLGRINQEKLRYENVLNGDEIAFEKVL